MNIYVSDTVEKWKHLTGPRWQTHAHTFVNVCVFELQMTFWLRKMWKKICLRSNRRPSRQHASHTIPLFMGLHQKVLELWGTYVYIFTEDISSSECVCVAAFLYLDNNGAQLHRGCSNGHWSYRWYRLVPHTGPDWGYNSGNSGTPSSSGQNKGKLKHIWILFSHFLQMHQTCALLHDWKQF